MRFAKWKLSIVLAMLAPAWAGAVEPRLEANSHDVRSFDPPAVVSVPESAQYLGGKRWVLYGYADADLHLFVEKDAKDAVTRLYWIQSEGYIDSRPELTHAGDYDDSRKLELGGLNFHLDTWTRHLKDAAPPNSDLEQVERLIAEKRLTLPEEMAFVRLVHLPDEAQRKELMIIYAERATASPGPQRDVVADMKARIRVRKP